MARAEESFILSSFRFRVHEEYDVDVIKIVCSPLSCATLKVSAKISRHNLKEVLCASIINAIDACVSSIFVLMISRVPISWWARHKMSVIEIVVRFRTSRGNES